MDRDQDVAATSGKKTAILGASCCSTADAFVARAKNSSIEPSHFDDKLLARVALRDELAMAELFDLHSNIVFSVAFRVLNDAAAAEDVMQETFMRIWRDPGSFVATKGSLHTWLAIVARNRSIDLLRRRRPNDQIDDLNLASTSNLADEAQRSISLQRAWSAIALLPKEQGRYMEMAFSQGLTYAEIAKVTGHSLGTVKTRIRSALSTLRQELQS